MEQAETQTRPQVFEVVRSHLSMGRSEGIISTTEAARLLGVTMSTASYHLNGLVAEGLLRKAPKPRSRDFMLAEPTALETGLVKRFLKPATLDEARSQAARGEPVLDEDRLQRLVGLGLIEAVDPKAKGPAHWRATKVGFALIGHCTHCTEPYGGEALVSRQVRDVYLPGDRHRSYVSAIHLRCIASRKGPRAVGVVCAACGIPLHETWNDLPAVTYQDVLHAFDNTEAHILQELLHVTAKSLDEDKQPVDSTVHLLPWSEIVALRRSNDPTKSLAATRAMRRVFSSDLAQLRNVDDLVACMKAVAGESKGKELTYQAGIGLFVVRPEQATDSGDCNTLLIEGDGKSREVPLAELPVDLRRHVDEFRFMRDANFEPATCVQRAHRIWREASELRRARQASVEAAFDQLSGPIGAYYRQQRESPGSKETIALFGAPPRSEPPSAVVEHRDGQWFHSRCAATVQGTASAAPSNSRRETSKDRPVRGQENLNPMSKNTNSRSSRGGSASSGGKGGGAGQGKGPGNGGGWPSTTPGQSSGGGRSDNGK